jgi:hypothetical protein
MEAKAYYNFGSLSPAGESEGATAPGYKQRRLGFAEPAST